jgi:hypothetical protein
VLLHRTSDPPSKNFRSFCSQRSSQRHD